LTGSRSSIVTIKLLYPPFILPLVLFGLLPAYPTDVPRAT